MLFQAERLSDTEHVEHKADREQKAHEDLLKKRRFLMLRLVVADLLFSFGSQFLGYALGDHSRPAINPLEEMVYPAKQKKTAGIR